MRRDEWDAIRDVVARFARLGVTAFGGPVAHLGYFRREFVERAGWLDDAAFAEIVALCSVLPGPTSSQVGIVLGLRRAGPFGALAAWFCFTLPSAVALGLFGLALSSRSDLVTGPGWPGALAGFAGVAAAVVTLAVATMARSLAATTRRAAIAILAFAAAVLGARAGFAASQILVLIAGAAIGALTLDAETKPLPTGAPALRISRRTGAIAGALFAALLGASAFAPPNTRAGLAAIFVRAGSLVFGGGHVVLPFLESALGPATGRPALVPANVLLAGYGAAQSVPGPLFTFAAFLGAVNRSPANGPLGALIATVAIFLPSFLLIAAAVPLWSGLRSLPRANAVLAGANAAVVGLLGAVLVDPIAPALAASPIAAAVTLPAFFALTRLKVPAWGVALACGAAGAAIDAARIFVR